MIYDCLVSFCVKSIRIWSFSGPYFPAFRMSTERCGVLSLHVGKYRPEKLRIRTHFTECQFKTLKCLVLKERSHIL